MGKNNPEFLAAAAKVADFPIKTYLSFEPIIKYWESRIEAGDEAESRYAQSLIDEVNQVPQLRKPLKNAKATVKKHQHLIDKLMAAVFPPALKTNEIKAAYSPFVFEAFKKSLRYQQLVEQNGGELEMPYNADPHSWGFLRYIHSCVFILATKYGSYHTLETPFIYKFQDPATGLDQYYKMTMNGDFCEIVETKKLKKLSEADIDEMVKNVLDVDLWLKNIPPENFEIHGVIMASLVNVTPHELVSNLKNDLLEKDAIVTDHRFEQIRHSVRSLFKIPDLRVGLGVYKDGGTSIGNFGHYVWRDVVCKSRIDNIGEEYKDSIYQQVFNTREPVISENIEDIKNPTGIVNAIKETCVKSIMVAPLEYNNEIIGYLEIGACTPKALNAFYMSKLYEILPLFSIALKRSMDERDTQIEAIIKEKCTAIHPTVEWRFKQAAKKLLGKIERQEEEADMEPIVFEDVYPLYGLSDIRNSSNERNKSIQADLIAQLELAKGVIDQAKKRKKFPIMDEFGHRMTKMITSINRRIKSENESEVYGFLNREVEPLFEYLENEDVDLANQINEYREKLDPKLGVLYQSRKAYEDSVTMINDKISDFLDDQEKEAQQMYPHYFEKYKTDGVDYNIYVGASLSQKHNFNLVCLHNLRLWQFSMMCELTRTTNKLIPQLPVPLATTQLILVHNEPLAIRFRMDEKQFDVDGAYNIRYEIVKKRIDKAYIRGTEERLTQPNTIAIVYNQSEVADEYTKYINYLQSIGYLNEEVEDLKLEQMQGVHGLRALRVRVKMRSDKKLVQTKEIEEIISKLNN